MAEVVEQFSEGLQYGSTANWPLYPRGAGVSAAKTTDYAGVFLPEKTAPPRGEVE